MDKQKLSGIIMVPVVAIAVFVAYRSYRSTLAPDTGNPATTSAAGRSSGGGGGAPGGAGGGAQRGPTPAQMVDDMAKELTLSATQKTQILAIQEDLAAKRKAFPKDMARDERRKQMTVNRTAADAKINALLSPDQQKKYAAMQEKRRAQMQASRQGGGGPGGGAMGGGSGGGPMMGGPGGGPKGGGMAPGSGGSPKSNAPTPGKPMASPGG
ncbi:MAG: hypothetical protein JWL77_6272 [Chthonomonadaceae bacterium]|nr:hypothetical protein [Chthonomonadaceae bacterium]